MSHTASDGGTTGLQDAENVLVCYSQLYRLDPNGMRFTLDAELTLHAAGRHHEIKNQPPEPFETSGGPMAKAIRKGLADGSISPDVDVREIYYNSYDADPRHHAAPVHRRLAERERTQLRQPDAATSQIVRAARSAANNHIHSRSRAIGICVIPTCVSLADTKWRRKIEIQRKKGRNEGTEAFDVF